MTRVTFFRRPNGYAAVELIGHAGYAFEGEDVVCAGISSSIQLVSALLSDVRGIPIEEWANKNEVYIKLALPRNRIHEGQDAFQALKIQMNYLGRNYPQFIHVTEVYNDAAD